jgi:hypothetical protein
MNDNQNDIKINERPTKDNTFGEEQEKILSSIFNILNLTSDDKKSFIDKDILETKKDEINQLFPQIKKYYTSKIWKNIMLAQEQKKHMSIIRSILKHHGYSFIFKNAQVTREDIKKVMQRYFIIKI